jgi:hypothetical protein
MVLAAKTYLFIICGRTRGIMIINKALFFIVKIAPAKQVALMISNGSLYFYCQILVILFFF